MRAAFVNVAASFLAFAAAAAEPTLLHLYPVAGQQGTTVSVAAAGKFDPWPPQVWIDAPGIAFKASKTKGKFDVEIAKDAKAGPHLVRFFNEQGASAPRFFIVSDEPEILEVEPNDEFRSPQKIANLPATISGRLDKPGDVDSFAVTLRRGQKFVAWVEAYVLASTFDGMLRIVDQNGDELAFNHDGRTLDPFLTWEAPRDGTFVVQLMGFAYPATADVRLTGGETCVYRLHLSAAPNLRLPPPPHDAIQGTELTQQEPDASTNKAQSVAIPCTIAGCVRKAGEEERFAFTAVKKHSYELRLLALDTVSPIEAWLRIENKDGKAIARNNDGVGARTPHLTWTAPSDGVFTAAVGDLTHHGGSDYVYRLAMAEAVPSVTGTTEGHAIAVKAGKTEEAKVAVKRANGFASKLKLAAKDLPEGISAAEVDVPEKDGEVVLKLTAEPGAKAASKPIQLVLREAESGGEHPVLHMMTNTAENNGVPNGYTELVIDSTDLLWLTVIAEPAKPEPPKAEPPK